MYSLISLDFNNQRFAIKSNPDKKEYIGIKTKDRHNFIFYPNECTSIKGYKNYNDAYQDYLEHQSNFKNFTLQIIPFYLASEICKYQTALIKFNLLL